jgi:hypothetical protein
MSMEEGKMDKKSVHEAINRMQIEDSLRQEFEGTLPNRVSRYLQVKPHPIIGNTHFAAISSECRYLHRDGHYYGCIALTQAVAEALVKFLCSKNSWRPKNTFETNVKKLSERGVILEEAKEHLDRIWENRDDYHHLNPNIEKDREKLEGLAKEKLLSLNYIEGEVFAFSIVEGKVMPKYPRYWDISDNKANVFLRFE